MRRSWHRRVAPAAIVTLLAGLWLIVSAATASAATTTYFRWGKNYVYDASWTQAVGAWKELYSPDGAEKLNISTNGGLFLEKRLLDAKWHTYWSSHTTGTGFVFTLQHDGRLVERASDDSVIWQSGKAPGAGYNYAVTLANSGRLQEWYSTGDPLATSGRRLLWQIDRNVGYRSSTCPGSGGPMSSGTNAVSALLQRGDGITVTVHNRNALGLMVDVSRYYQGLGESGHDVRWVAPWTDVTFDRGGLGWYGGDNLPETVTMHASTTAQSVAASAIITGYCWYKP